MSVVGVDDALDWFVVAVSSVVGSCGYVVGFVFSGLLSGSRGFDAMQVLLIKSSIVIDAMFPVVFFEDEVVVEDVLSVYHFSFFPLCFVEASLDGMRCTLG